MNTIGYVALLRGVNVGGKMVKMESVRRLLESIEYTNVKTILNSGNVVFDSAEKDIAQLAETLEKAFEKEFGFRIDTIVRTMEEIQALVESNPFKEIEMTPQTRLYVTFLSNMATSSLSIPYESPEKDFRILKVGDNVVLSTITLSTNKSTTDMMKILEKEFGKKITTRNWNTVKKIAVFP